MRLLGPGLPKLPEVPDVPDTPDVPFPPAAPSKLVVHDENAPVPAISVMFKTRRPVVCEYDTTSP